jgi:hypothetical protein
VIQEVLRALEVEEEQGSAGQLPKQSQLASVLEASTYEARSLGCLTYLRELHWGPFCVHWELKYVQMMGDGQQYQERCSAMENRNYTKWVDLLIVNYVSKNYERLIEKLETYCLKD